MPTRPKQLRHSDLEERRARGRALRKKNENDHELFLQAVAEGRLAALQGV